MKIAIDGWPKWLRWVLFLPASLLGGLLAGILAEFVSSQDFVTSRAPALYFLATFLGGLARTWTAFFITHSFVPSHKKTVIIVIGLLTIAGHLSIIPSMVRLREYAEILRLAGDFLALFIVWRKYIYATGDSTRQEK
jgi:hypothetical protein